MTDQTTPGVEDLSPLASLHVEAESVREPAGVSDIRRRAWDTRRRKYGAAGHAGSYSRGPHPTPTVLDVIECEEGYPTEQSMLAFRAMVINRTEAARFLTEAFPGICGQLSACSCAVESATDFLGRPIKRVTFSTGGWLGAEDLISAMLEHFWIKQLHTAWRRGGHFEFEVPIPALDTPHD